MRNQKNRRAVEKLEKIADSKGAMAHNGDGLEWKENLNVRLKCPDCKEDPPNLIEEDSSTVCASCGVVLADRIVSMESEWRTFSNDDGKNADDPSRVGEAANELLNGNQLETAISWAGNGGRIARDLQRAQNRQLENKSNKALQGAYMDIDQKCDAYGIQHNVKNTAKTYYKSTQDAKAFKGKNVDVVIAGCIFLACRQCGVGRSFNEIFSMTSVPKKEIGRVYKQLEKFLYQHSESRTNAIVDGGGIANPNTIYKSSTATKPKELCSRFCNNLGLGFKVISMSQKLAEKITEGAVTNLSGRSPLSIVSACIYFASHLAGQGKSAKEISKVAKVSDGTIRTAYKLMLPDKDTLVEKDWLEKGASMDNLPNA